MIAYHYREMEVALCPPIEFILMRGTGSLIRLA